MNDLTIRVDDPNSLIGYGGDMKNYAGEFSDQIKNIYNELNILAESWTGAKSENFMNTLGKYKTSFTEFGDNLNDFGELMIKTGDAYSSWNK